MKVLINGKEIELTDSVQWEVRKNPYCGGRKCLFNLNTQRYEGIDGDVIDYRYHGRYYQGHVIGYTCFQVICTAEYGKVKLSAVDGYEHKSIIEHNGEIEEV